MNSRLLSIGLTAFSVEAQKYVCRFSRQPFPLIFIPPSSFPHPPSCSRSTARRENVVNPFSMLFLKYRLLDSYVLLRSAHQNTIKL